MSEISHNEVAPKNADEEALDLACYLRGAIWERDNPEVTR